MTGGARRVCSDAACGFVQRTNPTPAVGALVEYKGNIILARNVKWPEGWFALITGYLEAGEEPTAAVQRELKEELNLDAVEIHPIGNYIFERKNEVMLCYHVVAAGELKLGAELCDYRRYKPHELKPWPRATGSLSRTGCGRGSRGGIRRLSSVVVQAFSLLSRITKARRSRRYFFEKELLRVLRVFVKCRPRYVFSDRNSASRRSRKRRSGACFVSSSARSYAAIASAVRPSRRHRSARAECAR